MQKHTVNVPKTARYFQLGEFGENTTDVWIVCHGYAQTAPEFLSSFSHIAAENRVIVAPEGLHRFYARGTSERVAASWMTKEDRLDDIADYVRWLDLLADEVRKKMKQNARITVLGFSQGAATVARWLALGKTKAQRLILFCGFFPPDMDFSSSGKVFREIDLHIVTASDDQYISAEQENQQFGWMKDSGITFQHHRFEGKHITDEATLSLLAGR